MTPDQVKALRLLCERLAAARTELRELTRLAFDAELANVSELDVWRMRTAADLAEDFLDQARRAIRVHKAIEHVAQHSERPGWSAADDPIARFALAYDELRAGIGFGPVAFQARVEAWDAVRRARAAGRVELDGPAAAAVELAGQG